MVVSNAFIFMYVFPGFLTPVLRSFKANAGKRLQTFAKSPHWMHRSRLMSANNRKRDFKVVREANKNGGQVLIILKPTVKNLIKNWSNIAL